MLHMGEVDNVSLLTAEVILSLGIVKIQGLMVTYLYSEGGKEKYSFIRRAFPTR